MDLKNKVTMLTAGARIGQAVAQSLALHGCNLALIYRASRDAAEASAQAATREGVRAITIQADATDEDQIIRAVEETHRELGGYPHSAEHGADLSEHARTQRVRTGRIRSMPIPAASFFSRQLQRGL
jgi:NAD(P)-dependent dehydrogenase (short-subunit alcohol dehydrogenase family)